MRAASVHSVSRSRPISGAKVRALRSRRTTSSARFLAVAISHADGFSGTPRTFQTSSARQKASCRTSSASARLCTPKIRVSAATSRPHSLRNRCSFSSGTLPLLRKRAPPARRALGVELPIQTQDRFIHRADLHGSAALEHRATLRELRRLGQVARLDDDEARDQVFDLDVGTVGDRLFLAADYFSGVPERLPRVLQVTLLFQPAHPSQPHLHALLRSLRISHEFALLRLAAPKQIDELAHRSLLMLRQPPTRPLALRHHDVRADHLRTFFWSFVTRPSARRGGRTPLFPRIGNPAGAVAETGSVAASSDPEGCASRC